jgi:hypothetical protein
MALWPNNLLLNLNQKLWTDCASKNELYSFPSVGLAPLPECEATIVRGSLLTMGASLFVWTWGLDMGQQIALEDREARRLFPVERLRFGVDSVKMCCHYFVRCNKELQCFVFVLAEICKGVSDHKETAMGSNVKSNLFRWW